MNAILIMFHLELDAGYAMDSLLETFLEMAAKLVVDREKIHISFTCMKNRDNQARLSGYSNVIEFDPGSTDVAMQNFIRAYVEENGIDLVFGFDLPVHKPAYKPLRQGGVKTIISYQGAPMSDLNKGIKLILKKLQVSMAMRSPDYYIFESRAMAETAFRGRGVPENKVTVVPLGVDTEKYRPAGNLVDYPYKTFSIPENRKIIYYSGHMEKRKGVDVLINAAIHLRDVKGRDDFHLLILGNRPGEEAPFEQMLQDKAAESHVTFAGYRDDAEQIIPACYVGAIASTGWDSFTMSSLEIAACGLPLIVSALQGLLETIDEGKTGFSFKPGDYVALAEHVARFLDDPELRNRFGDRARDRILSGFSRQHQVNRLVGAIQSVCRSGAQEGM